jgi:hypothetical protein
MQNSSLLSPLRMSTVKFIPVPAGTDVSASSAGRNVHRTVDLAAAVLKLLNFYRYWCCLPGRNLPQRQQQQQQQQITNNK